MPRSRSPGRILLTVAFGCCLGAADPVEDERTARAQLQELKRAIEQITTEQRRDEATRGRLQQRLREAETALGRLGEAVTEVEARIGELAARQAGLESRRQDLAAERDAQRERVVSELRAAWQSGSGSQLKLLLNQEEPEAVARLLAYYRYLARARKAQIDAFRATLAELAAAEAAARENRAELGRERATLVERREQLAAARDKRQQAVAALSAGIAERGERLASLEQDAAALETLLEELAAAARTIAAPAEYQPFSAARGAMPWPAAGQHLNSFGRPRNQGKMRWRGITISAETGTTVAAIHHGRVVYADWLRGSGLLLVLDHGDGYLSLYAHNESLLRDVGDWVNAGSPIATVGASGGRERPALYFEIRQNGKPVDPAGWCRG